MRRAHAPLVASAPVRPAHPSLLPCVSGVVSIPGAAISHGVLVENGIPKAAGVWTQARIHDHDIKETTVPDLLIGKAGFYHGHDQLHGERGGGDIGEGAAGCTSIVHDVFQRWVQGNWRPQTPCRSSIRPTQESYNVHYVKYRRWLTIGPPHGVGYRSKHSTG